MSEVKNCLITPASARDKGSLTFHPHCPYDRGSLMIKKTHKAKNIVTLKMIYMGTMYHSITPSLLPVYNVSVQRSRHMPKSASSAKALCETRNSKGGVSSQRQNLQH